MNHFTVLGWPTDKSDALRMMKARRADFKQARAELAAEMRSLGAAIAAVKDGADYTAIWRELAPELFRPFPNGDRRDFPVTRTKRGVWWPRYINAEGSVIDIDP